MRITKEMKSGIVAKAMLGFKADEKQQLKTDVIAFADKVYDHFYGADEAIILKSGLAERWYRKDGAIHISCEGFGWHNRLAANDYDTLNEHALMSRDRIFPLERYQSEDAEIEQDHLLFKEARALVRRHCSIRKAEDELREKIVALLGSISTFKQLQAAWPEGAQFLPKGAQVSSTALVPVGLSDQINKALGIPSAASVATDAVRKAAQQ